MSARGSCEHLSTAATPSSSLQQHFGHFDACHGSHTSTQSSNPAPPLSLGLLRLLEERGISGSTLPHPYHHMTPLPAATRPQAEEETRGGSASAKEEERSRNIFSFNLMAKLRGLGLHGVAARGEADPSREEQEAVGQHRRRPRV